MNPDHDCFCDGREECEPAFEPTPVSPPGRGLREAVEALVREVMRTWDTMRSNDDTPPGWYLVEAQAALDLHQQASRVDAALAAHPEAPTSPPTETVPTPAEIEIEALRGERDNALARARDSDAWRHVAAYYLGDFTDTHTPEECRAEAFRRATVPAPKPSEVDLGDPVTDLVIRCGNGGRCHACAPSGPGGADGRGRVRGEGSPAQEGPPVMTAPTSPPLTDARRAIAIMERMKEIDAGDGLETSDHDTVIAALLLAAERAEHLATALRDLLDQVKHIPGLSSAGAIRLVEAARRAERALDAEKPRWSGDDSADPVGEADGSD